MFAFLGLRESSSSTHLAFAIRRFSLPLLSKHNHVSPPLPLNSRLLFEFIKGKEQKEVGISVEEGQGVEHPSAIVHPHAVIGKGVSIGPFCTVGPCAEIGDNCHLYAGSHIFGNTKLGESCTLMTGAIVGDDLPGRTVIGNNNVVGHHAVVGIKCQDLKYKPRDECFLRVGNRNVIREYTSIHRSSRSTDVTVVGNDNFIMGSCHIAHDCKVGSFNIFANNTLLAGHVVVEDHIHTAGATAVHQFCHLSSFSFIGGGSVVAQDVPMYMMVAGDRAELRGLNMEGLRRNGFSLMEIKSLRAAYRKLFMQCNENDGLECRLMELEQQEPASINAVRALVRSIRESLAEERRGICKIRNWTDT